MSSSNYSYNGSALTVTLEGQPKTVDVIGELFDTQDNKIVPFSSESINQIWRYSDGTSWQMNDNLNSPKVFTDPIELVAFPHLNTGLANYSLTNRINFKAALQYPYLFRWKTTTGLAVPNNNVTWKDPNDIANISVLDNKMTVVNNIGFTKDFYDVRKNISTGTFEGYYQFRLNDKKRIWGGNYGEELCDETTGSPVTCTSIAINNAKQEPLVRAVNYYPKAEFRFQSTATLYDYGGSITYSVRSNPVTIQDRFYNFNKTQLQATPTPSVLSQNINPGTTVNYPIPTTKPYNNKTYRADSSFLSFDTTSYPVGQAPSRNYTQPQGGSTITVDYVEVTPTPTPTPPPNTATLSIEHYTNGNRVAGPTTFGTYSINTVQLITVPTNTQYGTFIESKIGLTRA